MKYRFAIIGSGWRAAYYMRIAAKLPEIFELGLVYCRSEEKALKVSTEWGVKTTCSEEEIVSYQPDFIVVSVSKSSGAEVALQWMKRGFTILAETPAGLDLSTLEALWDAHLSGQKLVIAEQYTRYPTYSALLRLINEKYIGDVNCINISLAHDYHGASLMRAFLGLSVDTPFSVRSKAYSFPVTETLTRYEKYDDGRVALKKRTAAVFEFDNGKVAFYDFDSEQYRSPIRRCSYRISGIRGEITDGVVRFLDEENRAVEESLKTEIIRHETGAANPNFAFTDEIAKITFKDRILYEAPFGIAKLSEDEPAVALLMRQTAEYARGNEESPYQLRDALQDAYMSILMHESESEDKMIRSSRKKWM